MGRAAMKSVLALLALVVSLAVTTGASAAIVTSTDLQGRQITFDVRATRVDTNWYADILRAISHGNEISNVTVRIVRDQSIDTLCGNEAAACFTHVRDRPTIMIPAGKNQFIEGTLIHEYGHFLDESTPNPGYPELNGIPVWWADRGISTLLATHTVAYDYSLGWSHSIAEIFAEDYAYINFGPTYHYAITWLSPPDDKLKADMFAALGPPDESLPAAPNTPLTIDRVGTLAPRATRDIPFGLLGPGRHVVFRGIVSRPRRKGVRARMEIVCNGSVLATQTFGRGRARGALDVPNLGPADCDARLVSSAGVSLKYTLHLELSVEGEPAR
jgi:hypothetical protein